LKKVVFLSSLDNSEQRGGAYLRVNSLCQVLKLWSCEVELIYQKGIKLSGFFSKLWASFRFGPEIKVLFSRADINIPSCDFLMVDNLRHLHWTFHFHRKHRPLIIYNAHNLEFENYYGKSNSRKRKKFSYYEAKKMDECDFIFVCSLREKKILIKIRPELEQKIYIFPNLVNAQNYSPDSNEKKWITFIGTLDYFPNREAVEFITGDFQSNLPIELKDKVIIAGRNPSPYIKELCQRSGITLKENLSDRDVLDLLAQTKVSLVPLKSGSGTRLKILESIFSKSMVLTTPMGAEGIASTGLKVENLDQFTRVCAELYFQQKFSDLCSDSTYQMYLDSYDYSHWAKSNHSQFNFLFR
jgi:glycosyltransferase involved in cell wall biosynthesis